MKLAFSIVCISIMLSGCVMERPNSTAPPAERTVIDVSAQPYVLHTNEGKGFQLSAPSGYKLENSDTVDLLLYDPHRDAAISVYVQEPDTLPEPLDLRDYIKFVAEDKSNNLTNVRVGNITKVGNDGFQVPVECTDKGNRIKYYIYTREREGVFYLVQSWTNMRSYEKFEDEFKKISKSLEVF